MAWPLQHAKQQFSRLVDAARTEGPQVVTRHGREVVVVLSVEEYRSLSGRSVKEALHDFGEATDGVFDAVLAEVVASRRTDPQREIDVEP